MEKFKILNLHDTLQFHKSVIHTSCNHNDETVEVESIF